MKKFENITFIVVVLLLLSGCVSTKEYNSKVSELDSMKNENTALQQKIDELTKKDADLENKIKELQNTIAERTNSVREWEQNAEQKQLEIAKLRQELDATAQEKLRVEQEKARVEAEKEKAIAELNRTYNNLVAELKEEIKQGEIEVVQLKDKLSLSMVEKILFDSGSSVIKKHGKEVLDRVAGILKKVSDRQIRIEGHTDNVPIGERIKEKFPTNWELSTARATNVVKYLIEKGVDPNLLSPAGYGQYRPVAPNDTEEGRAKNRRIEIVLIPLDLAPGKPVQGSTPK
ncbi:MAG: OmpA family protein [bacterium]